ncbi:squalene/phytoene synthase family protein [Salisediminibacterium halotolerans]|uniref:Farnesyl-diphosphate farnesyltransferase n=1 Tax=Salisediminibacterium halotolerans TaxID=517425 RepID=A0A1H9R4R9_9BACI|nr:phytoene/squalene synthase family protein [Salisediminibacterium haloalkalitolerans]SER67690.1 farnesyl-diphosphate farnesyltransferase [Salisediminibacterium haloalkalitolerans]
MNATKQLEKDAMRMLKLTSRTFYIPITLLEKDMKHAVASAYLCMRAVDEIEDHPDLNNDTKAHLLRGTAALLCEDTFNRSAYDALTAGFKDYLPHVTLRLADWLDVCPEGAKPKVKESTSIMAGGMASWADKNWHIKTEEDLDDYTYYVAGLVGVMLSDIWDWYDGTKTDYQLAIGYGRGLQTVNILRNQDEDAERGVSFVPDGWSRADLFHYAETNLAKGDAYLKDIQNRSITLFCNIPLALAKKTLKALRDGREKISRDEVEQTVEDIKSRTGTHDT